MKKIVIICPMLLLIGMLLVKFYVPVKEDNRFVNGKISSISWDYDIDTDELHIKPLSDLSKEQEHYEDYVFAESGIRNIVIPRNVEILGDGAESKNEGIFKNCESLEHVRFKTKNLIKYIRVL